MSRNRYIGDYRIVESMDGRGRVRTEYEYIGLPWRFAEDREAVRRGRGILAGCAAGGWVAFAAALAPASTAARTLYAVLPLALAALPLGLLTGLVWRLFRVAEPFEHRHADQIENRGPAYTFFIALLGSVAAAGAIVALVRGGAFTPGDGAFIGGGAALAGLGLTGHRQWRRLRCLEVK